MTSNKILINHIDLEGAFKRPVIAYKPIASMPCLSSVKNK